MLYCDMRRLLTACCQWWILLMAVRLYSIYCTYISYKIIIGSIFIGIFMNIEAFQKKYFQFVPIRHKIFVFL